MNLITAERVAKRFRAPSQSWFKPGFLRPWVDALCDVTFQVAAGECIALVGENGSGKSTLLRLIAGLLAPDEGRLIVQRNGCSTLHSGALAYLPAEDRGLFYDLTTAQNLKFFSLLYGLDRSATKAAIDQLIQELKLSEFVAAPVGQLSTGYRRRVALARSLLCRPRLLLLDEPTRGLDSQARTDLLLSLTSRKRQGVSIVLATHHADEAEQLCDRRLRLQKGRLVDDAVLTRPA